MVSTKVRSPVQIEERANLGLKAGDTVRVWQKIEEKGKTRLQAFEGLVLARKHGNEAGATFTVRRVASGVGVERIFPLYSPLIDKIELVKRATVRRAKLYYIREKVAREIKRAMRGAKMLGVSTESEIGRKDRALKEAQAAEAAEAAAAEALAQEEAAAVAPEAGAEVAAPEAK
jgi:large subunit ribosomal protein L19